jgi:hypothetical protein
MHIGEEKIMGGFKPSGNFVDRVMHDVRAYEMNRIAPGNNAAALIFSKPVFSMLFAGGILLGILNIVRMALILIAPTPCF